MLANIAQITNYLLPVLALIILLVGIIEKEKRLKFLIATVWLSLFILISQYLRANGEILGNYFNYSQAALYSATLIILVVAILILCHEARTLERRAFKVGAAFVSAFILISAVILGVNVWMNAYFISDKLKGTAIMQVVSFTPPDFCASRSIFYKVSSHGQVMYLCPNRYGLIPSISTLEVAPNFLVNQFQQRAHSAP